MSICRWFAVSAAVCFSCGCAAVRHKVSDVDLQNPEHLRSTYDYADMRGLTKDLAGKLLNGKWLGAGAEPPVVMIAGVQNRTERYVDTKGLTDRLRTLLHESGKVKFVNESRRAELMKERAYQAANATPETQVAVGKELGAQYMLSGSFMEMKSESQREVRLSKKEINYYKLTIEITDLKTSIIEDTAEIDFARKASLPLIGW